MPPDRSRRPRQDPVSCDSCRKKKLKCDRVQPCSNCRSRQIPCILPGFHGATNQTHLGDGSLSATTSSPPTGSVVGTDGKHAADAALIAENETIRARLLKLEEIVLGNRQAAAPQLDSSAERLPSTLGMQTPPTTVPPNLEPDSMESEHLKGLTGDTRWLESAGSHENSRIPHLITTTSLLIKDMSEIVAGSYPNMRIEGVILIPSYEVSMKLLDGYMSRVDILQHIIYKPFVTSMVKSIHERLSLDSRPNFSQTALYLALLASIAAHYSFNDRGTGREEFFDSRPAVVSVALYWLKCTLDVLEKARRTETPSLEMIQATIIIIFMIFHIEAFSPKSRFFHANAVAAARELGIHLTDSKDNIRKRGSDLTQAQIIDIEMRRRVWWHLCATDWSIAVTGGPQEGTYLIHPQHMMILKPRNITDEDLGTKSLDFDRPTTDASAMSYYLHRIRLGELCREVADLTWEMLVGVEPEQIPYEKIISFDRRFEELLNLLPTSLRLDALVPQNPDEDPNNINTLRYFTNVTISARRCKLHLPFLLRLSRNPRYHFSRDTCLRSAHDILRLRHACLSSIAAASSLPELHTALPMSIFLHHFFCAILTLVMDLCVNRSAGDEKTRTEEIRSACMILEAAKEQSVAAGVFLDSLLQILRKHKVRILQQDLVGPLAGRRPTSSSEDLSALPNQAEAIYKNYAADGQASTYPSAATTTNQEQLQNVDLDELWKGYLEMDAEVSPQEWDALFNDLDSML